jgi:hypothetical protein
MTTTAEITAATIHNISTSKEWSALTMVSARQSAALEPLVGSMLDRGNA